MCWFLLLLYYHQIGFIQNSKYFIISLRSDIAFHNFSYNIPNNLIESVGMLLDIAICNLFLSTTQCHTSWFTSQCHASCWFD